MPERLLSQLAHVEVLTPTPEESLRFYTDVLGLDWARAHDEAHRLEHALSPVVEEKLAELLGMPSTCPHGNPIPGMPAPEAHHPIPLSQTKTGQALVVDRITE